MDLVNHMKERKIIYAILISMIIALISVSLACSEDDCDTNRLYDRIEIESKINLYARCLDWDRADEAMGKELFLSIFTDDCEVGYPSFEFTLVGKGDNKPTADDPGGIGWMYSSFNMSSQTSSVTLISNIVIDIDGDEAISSDRYAHIGYLKGSKDPIYSNATFSWGQHEGKWRKEDGQWRCYEWNGTAQFTGSS